MRCFACLHLIYTYLHIPENPPFSTNCPRVNLHVSTHTRKSTIFHELFTCKSTRIYTYPKIHHFPRIVHVWIFTYLHIPENPPFSTNCFCVNLHVSTHARKFTVFHELSTCKSTRIYTYTKIHHFPRIVHVWIFTYLHIPENPPFSTNSFCVNPHVSTHARKSTIFHELFTCLSTRIHTNPKIHHFPLIVHV